MNAIQVSPELKEMALKDMGVKRMLSESEARLYTGLGRTSLRSLASKIQCVHHYGRRVLYDRKKLDAYFDGELTIND